MIWHSTLLMTIIDVVMVLGALKALQILFRHRATILGMKIARPVQAIVAGLCIISGLYLAELYTMLVMPLYASDEAAMAAMRNLHLNWNWLVVLAGFAAIVAGLVYLVAKLFPQIATIIESLEAEVVERTRSAEALAESEERLSLAVQSANFGTWSRTVPGDRVIWDARTEAIFGLEPGAFEGTMEAFLARVHPDDRGRITTGHRRLMEEGVPYAVDFRIAWPGGEVRHITTRASLIRSDRDSSSQIIGMLHDITERKRVEDALRESEERFRTMVEQAGDAMFLIEPDGSFIDVNQRACDALGYTRAELLTLSVPEIDPVFPKERFHDLFEGLQLRASVTVEAVHQRKDGTTYPVEIRPD